MVTTTGALAVGSARQPGDAGSRWAIGCADAAEVVKSRRCREIGSASSEKFRGIECPAVEQAVAADAVAAGKLE